MIIKNCNHWNLSKKHIFINSQSSLGTKISKPQVFRAVDGLRVSVCPLLPVSKLQARAGWAGAQYGGIFCAQASLD